MERKYLVLANIDKIENGTATAVEGWLVKSEEDQKKVRKLFDAFMTARDQAKARVSALLKSSNQRFYLKRTKEYDLFVSKDSDQTAVQEPNRYNTLLQDMDAYCIHRKQFTPWEIRTIQELSGEEDLDFSVEATYYCYRLLRSLATTDIPKDQYLNSIRGLLSLGSLTENISWNIM